MPASRFTNVPQNGFTPSWTSTSRQYAPYAAKGKFTNLTEKERLARRIRTSNMSGAGGYGGPSPMGGGSNTALSGNSSFFSPQLSTDFLELPQSLREKREIYRHFYNSDPLVGQAIDLHTELPLSKVRLSTPKPQHCPPEFKNADNYGKYILDFFERMCDKIDLFKRLLTLTHHYWLDGNCVSGDVLVSTRSGEVPIKQVLVGDEVLTNKGRWKSVEAVMQRESEGLIAIKVSRLPDTIDVTSEHPMETLRGDSWKFVLASEVKKGDYLRVTWPTITSDLVSIDLLKGVPGVKLATKNSYSIIRKCSHLRDEQAVRARSKLLSWLSSLESPTIRTRKSLAKEFGVDLPTLNNVIITLDSEFGSGYHKRIGPVGFSKGSQTVWYPTNEVRCSSEHYTISREYYFSAKPSIQVDQDFLYLVGYWLGDGTLSRDSKRMSWGRGIWNICFGRDSRPQYTRVKEILTNKLGADCIRESVDSVGMRTIYVKHHPAFIEWWSTQFGGTSHGLNPKRVPAWVSQLPADKTLAFIAGIVDSDGCVSVSKCKKGIVSIGLTSRNLIFSIRDLLLRVGVVPSLRVSDTKDGLIGSQVIKANHQVYYLTVESRDQCCLVTSMSLKGKNIRPDTKFVKGHPSYKVLADGTVGFLVSDVSNISSGTVYNLQVSDDSTFRAGFVSTHNCFIFAEDSSVDIPVDVGHKVERRPMAILNEDGTGTETDEEVVEPYSDHEERDLAYYQKHYKGWSKLVILPIDQVKLTTFSFTDKVRIELIPSDRDKVLFTQAKAGDERAQEMVEEIPAEVREYIESGKLIPLGTDADEGSFCYHLAARRGAGEDLGASILDRCLRCHLPGTPVLTQRNGFITQAPIETLDPDTDLVLVHTGIWRGFEIGVRTIDEEVALIKVAKLHPPIACTKEHKYFVLREGTIINVLAGGIQPGDALQIPQLPLTESVLRFDLSLDFDGSTKEYIASKSGLCVTQTTEINDTSFTVVYSKPETSTKRQRHLSNLTLAVSWLQSLSESTTIRTLKFCDKFGFNHNSLDRTLEKLANLGAKFEVIGHSNLNSSAFDLIFYPSKVSEVHLEREIQKTFPRWLDLTSELGYFLGYWLGDGHITREDGLDYGCLGFTFGTTEPASVLSIEQQIKPTLDRLSVSWSETKFKQASGSNISGYQDALIRWVASNFGHISEDKHLPAWIFDAPKDFLFGLLRGFIDSDGDVVVKKDGSISVRLNGTNRPRVRDTDADLRSAIRAASDRGLHRDLSLVRELGGIRKQVEQNLSNADGVGANGGEVLGRFLGQTDGLVLDQARGGRHDAGDDLGQARLLQGDVHLAGLDLCQVQKVVDQPKQMLPGAVDRRDVLPLYVGDWAVNALQDDPRESDDRIQGSPQFVAHVGEELRLDPVKFPHFLDRLLRELVGPGVVDGNRHLICQDLQRAQIVWSEGVDAVSLNIQRTNDPVAHPQGDGALCPCVRQQRIWRMRSVGRGVVENPRLAGERNLADNRISHSRPGHSLRTSTSLRAHRWLPAISLGSRCRRSEREPRDRSQNAR